MYKAIISRITVRPHPNADRLQLGNCYGHQVVTGLNAKSGDIGIFFPPDGQLSLEYCEENKLLKKDGGYFDDNRRVRAQKFRQEKSEGLWMPISSLDYTGAFDVSVGDMLDILNGHAICNKYETKRTRVAGNKNRNRVAVHNMYFKKHIDTEQFRFFKESIPDNSYIIITEKLHGTSGRYGHVLCETPRKWWQRLLRIKPKLEYSYLLGSRNVILNSKVNPYTGESYYGNEQFRYDSVHGLTLHKGETIYYELVGDCGVDKPIMPAHPVKDKEVKAKYGESMRYQYGQLPGTTGLYVYRITMVNEEGVVTELSWQQVKQRCHELGLKYTPELKSVFYNKEHEVSSPEYTMENWVNLETEGPSTLDPTHIREGVVIRVEHETGTRWYKNKSFTFGVLEGYIKDDDNYEDTEEAS
jgi:hypothetical protein